MKTMTYIGISRHSYLHLYLINTWLKFERSIWNNNGDIYVQKMYVKNPKINVTYLHITLIDSKKDLPLPYYPFWHSLFDTSTNYLASSMYIDKQYRLYTDCAIKWLIRGLGPWLTVLAVAPELYRAQQQSIYYVKDHIFLHLLIYST